MKILDEAKRKDNLESTKNGRLPQSNSRYKHSKFESNLFSSFHSHWEFLNCCSAKDEIMKKINPKISENLKKSNAILENVIKIQKDVPEFDFSQFYSLAHN